MRAVREPPLHEDKVGVLAIAAELKPRLPLAGDGAYEDGSDTEYCDYCTR